MNTELVKELVKAFFSGIIPLAVVALSAWFAYHRYVRESEDRRETIVRAVFGDLANVYEHYVYSYDEFPKNGKDQEEVLTRSRWAQFGELKSVGELEKLGNLRPDEVRLLLQLNLRIRNNDQMFSDFMERIIERSVSLTEKDCGKARSRMKYCAETAREVLLSISSRHADLQRSFDELESKLSGYTIARKKSRIPLPKESSDSVNNNL